MWIREGGGTTFYDLDTARRVGSVPCELWSVRADGHALALRQQPIESFIQIDPTSGTCDRVADALSPELPYGDVYCYDYYYEPYWYLPPYEEPYWDERGCYHEGYSPYGSSCIGSYAAPSVARFDPEGDLWLTWNDYAPGGNHYDGTGPDVIDTWSTAWRRNDGLAFSGPGRTWTRDVDTWDAVDAALAPVGVPVEGGSLEDALDGRMVAGAADWRQAAMFVDGRDGTVLSPFAPFDARDVLAVGLDRYLALLPDRSVVLTDGEGSLTPFLPASSAERDLLEISPCP
ncbi:MAG: hypothetical protein KC621_08600 [Myxococcales bacterium]|nr:hypothetical protein [Myxococcales bacterium]